MYIKIPPLCCVDFVYPVILLQSGLPKAIPYAMLKKGLGKALACSCFKRGCRLRRPAGMDKAVRSIIADFFFFVSRRFLRFDTPAACLTSILIRIIIMLILIGIEMGRHHAGKQRKNQAAYDSD